MWYFLLGFFACPIIIITAIIIGATYDNKKLMKELEDDDFFDRG